MITIVGMFRKAVAPDGELVFLPVRTLFTTREPSNWFAVVWDCHETSTSYDYSESAVRLRDIPNIDIESLPPLLDELLYSDSTPVEYWLYDYWVTL